MKVLVQLFNNDNLVYESYEIESSSIYGDEWRNIVILLAQTSYYFHNTNEKRITRAIVDGFIIDFPESDNNDFKIIYGDKTMIEQDPNDVVIQDLYPILDLTLGKYICYDLVYEKIEGDHPEGWGDTMEEAIDDLKNDIIRWKRVHNK